MVKVHVAYDEFGRILSVSPEEGDEPVARPGVWVTKASVGGESEPHDLDEVARAFHIDVNTVGLVEGPLEPPPQD
jgi:hypothetical protein